MTKLLTAAKLYTPHGLKGAMKARVMLENPQILLGHTLPTSREGLTLTPTRVHAAGQGKFSIQFKEIKDRTAAEQHNLAEILLFIPESLIPPAPEGEVYMMELVGKPVHKADGTPAGTVQTVLENPAHPLMELDNGILIPAHAEFVEDLSAKTLVLTDIGEQLLEI